MDNNESRGSRNSSNVNSSSSSSSSFEADFFASSPFLVSLAAFVHRQLLLLGVGDRDDAPPVPSEGKPTTLTSLSPEVLGRLLHVNREAAAARTERQHPRKGLGSAAATAAAIATPAVGDYDDKPEFSRRNTIVREDGSVDWPRVGIASTSEGGEEATLAEGARLAVLCHEALQRQREISSSQAQWMGGRLDRAVSGPSRLPFSRALQGVAERIVRGGGSSSPSNNEQEGEKEEVYAALCVCLAILERALYDIHHGANGRPDEPCGTTTSAGVTRAAAAAAEGCTGGNIGDSVDSSSGDVGGVGVGDEDLGGEAVRPAMILRDLIATPEVKAALPEQMLAVLRLLLLPLRFNIRNLVWHGFLAPHELPTELASLVLTVTLSISDSVARDSDDSDPSLPRVESPVAGDAYASLKPEPPSAADGGVASETAGSTVGVGASVYLGRDLEPAQLVNERSESRRAKTNNQCSRDDDEAPPPLHLPPLLPPPAESLAFPAWELSSFDDRLRCPEALSSAVESLLDEKQRGELSALVRRSAFVLPGREGMVLSALRALAEGRQAFFLVAILPVLEHGLRCLFACANDSPAHLFAQLRQYYSTLDGFGQRARHQLLLDQEMSGCPGQPNLLLAALGPGLSACLLDLFMMSAGPCLRGKVAHGELDMSCIFTKPSPEICSSSSPLSSSAAGSHESDNCDVGSGSSHAMKLVPSTAGVVSLTAGVFLALCGRYDIIERGLEGAPHSGIGGGASSPRASFSSGDGGGDGGGIFVKALASCDSHCSGWTPRFHPHELLEEDLRDSWTQLDRLALALERREISVEVLPGVNLARMSVVVSLCDDDGDDGNSGSGGRSDGEGGDDVHPPATGRAPYESTRERKQGGRQEARATEGDRGGSSGAGGGGSSSVVEGGKEGSSLSGTPTAGLVLTLTDTASRLILPPAEVEDRQPLSVSAKTGRGKVKGRGSTAGASASSGMFPGVLRVNDALRPHIASLTGRSRRSVHRGGQSGGTPRHSSSAPPDRLPGRGCRWPGPAPGKGRLSAFAVYMHSDLCRDATTCGLECLDRASTSALGDTLRSTNTSTDTSTSISTSTSSPLTSKENASAEPRADGATASEIPRSHGDPSPRTDEGVTGNFSTGGTNVAINRDTEWRRDTQRDTRRGLCREGGDAGFVPERPDREHSSIDNSDGNVRPISETNASSAPAPAPTTTPMPTPAPTPSSTPAPTSAPAPTPKSTPTLTPAPTPAPVPRTTRRFRRNREPGRISPPTNVVTAAPLPQIACMAGLCRSCADIARGLLARIGELEALLASGEARSGQRRAYAAALHVAPTLLRYLAAAAAAVEVFVVDWDARHDGEAFAAGVVGGRYPGSPPPHPDGTRGSDSGAVGLGGRQARVPVASAAAAATAAAVAVGATEAVGSVAVAAAAAAAGPPDTAASLGFLRRLAAVNGSLALCVVAGGERSATVGVLGKVAGSGGGNSGGVGGGGAVSVTARVEKSGGGGRKGYAQALAELASFLESKAARRGFAAF